MIKAGEVMVNGETELRRGRKLYPGDVVEADGRSAEVE
jgi:ribosome-associated protein